MKKSKSSKSNSENGSAKEPKPEDFLIVGIGASAGGIQALKTFFGNVPADSGAAYVVILHLSPEHESKLAEVLQTNAQVAVTQVTERVKVEPNHVFVVPPNQSLAMSDGHIVVSPIHTIEERRAPVDIFFRTLAETHHENAVCVVLSGTGADGSMGLKRVKENGGVVFVQNPREAEYSDMSRNAIATNLVDEVLNVAEIPAKIIEYRENRKAVALPVQPEAQPEEQQKALRDIFTQLRVRTGHDFTNYKRPTVLRRIERRIGVRSLSGIVEYARYLKEQPEEVQSLLKDLLISVTNFFRDKQAFAVLENDVVPRILENKRAGDQIRVWVAGCATGEEAYSIAMLTAEKMPGGIDAPGIQIFASDIDEAAIATAREGFYTINDAADVSPERLRRFFTKVQDGYRIRRELREMVLFANHNVLKDPPFSRLDMATCRNMLIYLNQAAQKRVMETFHFVLKPNGFLFLGASESIDGSIDLFAPYSKENNIFQSRNVESRIPRPERDLTHSGATYNTTFTQTKPFSKSPEPEDGKTSGREQQDSTPQLQAKERLSYADLHQQLVEQYAPPSVVVNEDYDILHLSERAGRFMRIHGGEPSNNLLKTIRPELRLELRTALYQAVQKRTNVEVENLTVLIDGRGETINIIVRPFLETGGNPRVSKGVSGDEKSTLADARVSADSTARGFILVLFEKTDNAPDGLETVRTASEPVARQLEEELIRVKAQLRSGNEQYEIQTEELKASNEELQAINEELRSSGEELETGKEELQSINEELITVNQELKIKIEELSQSNSDFQNLMASSDIGTIFLDRTLRVKMFTPATRRIINLLPADIGRPLTDITTQFVYEKLHDDCELVLEKLQPIEREILTSDNRWFLLRILPYPTAEDQISGVVLTFLDITERFRREAELKDLNRQIEQQVSIFNTTLSGISDFAYIFDRAGRFVYSNKPLLDLLGISLEEIIGKNFFDLNYPEDLAARLQKQIQQVFDTGKVVRDETPFTSPTGAGGFYEYIFTPVFAADGTTVESVAGLTRDVTERKQAEESLRFQAKLLDTVEQSAIATDLDGNIIYWNHFAEQLYGWKAEQAIGRNILEVTSADTSVEQGEEIMSQLRQGKSWAGEFTVKRRDGTEFPAQVIDSPITDAEGNLIGIVGVSIDITERKRAEEALRESEERLQLAASVSGFGIHDFDAEQNKLYWSPELKAMHGLAPDAEISFETLPELFHPEDRERVNRAMQAALNPKGDGEFEQEFRAVRQDTGEIIWLHSRSRTTFSGKGKNRKAVRNTGILVNISERKQIEEQKREQTEMLEQTYDAIFVWELDGGIVYWNRSAERIYGYAPREALGRNTRDLLKTVYPVSYEQLLAELLQENVWEGELVHTTKDNRQIDVESRFVVSERKDSKRVVLETVRDITERRQAEERLRESEERFSKAFNASPLILAISSLNNGKLIEVNETFVKIAGYTREEAIGKTTVELGLWTNAPEREDQMETVRQKGRLSNITYSFRTRSGEEIIGLLAAERIIIGGEPFALTVIQDITEQKRAEQQIRETEERSRLLIEGATDFAIFRISPDNLVESWNSGAERVFGWKESEIIGQSGAVLFTPEDRAAGIPEKEKQTAAKKGRAEDERWHIRKDGTRFFASGVMMRLNEGAEGFVKIARDQTAKIEAEKALRDRELLQKLVGAQEDERKRIARDLHDELGQKLTALRLQLENVRKICEAEEICGKIDEIQVIAKNIDADVDFLAWELRPAALDDLGLVAAIENYVREWSHHSGVTLEFHASGLKKARLVSEVETNFYRITQEALNNTHKHAKAKHVDVLLEKRDGSVILIIEDDGKGFNVKDKKNRSKGLGLVGMQERAALVGGTLEIESAPGQGTTIFARVPATFVKKEK